jgi:hypothetical protein
MERATREEMQKMKEYASILAQQLASKQREQRREKKVDLLESTSSRFTEELGSAVPVRPCS